MQTQGVKTITHMNTCISMLDFTSVPAWIIVYCFTAGGCFSCLSCKFFCKWYSPLGFFRIQAWIFRCSHTRPPLRGKVCWLRFLYGSHHGLNVVGPHWDFLFAFLLIFLQSVLSGYFNVGLSTSVFLQLGMLVLGSVACRPSWSANRSS